MNFDLIYPIALILNVYKNRVKRFYAQYYKLVLSMFERFFGVQVQGKAMPVKKIICGSCGFLQADYFCKTNRNSQSVKTLKFRRK